MQGTGVIFKMRLELPQKTGQGGRDVSKLLVGHGVPSRCASGYASGQGDFGDCVVVLGNVHGEGPHVQIHTDTGDIIRIFFGQ